MSTLACFVDFQGAYDTVSRQILLNKLADLTIAGNMLHWLSSFLSQRFVKVRYGNTVTNYRQQKRGLPQGAVLSCTLFNLMINDLITHLKKEPGIEVLCYADDVTIWATSSNVPALNEILNKSLLSLKTWSEANDMIVSKDKTTAQLFTLSTKTHSVDLKYDEAPIKVTPITKYLGMQLDCKLSWSPHVDNVSQKSTKRLCLLKRLTGTNWGATQDVLATTYKTYIRPLLEYGSEVLSTTNETTRKKLNIAQNNALRLICGAANSTPITALESHTQIEPLEARRDKAILKYFERANRTRDRFWDTYLAANSRLKTQRTPLTRAQELLKKYNLDVGDRQPFRGPELLLQTSDLPIQTLIPGIRDRKADISPLILKAAALEMITSQYPAQDWIHVYTDGSAMGDNCGAGYYSTLVEGAIPVGKLKSNFEGEITAISEAAKKLLSLEGTKKIVFLSDSTAAIQAIASPEPQKEDLVVQCQERLLELQTKTEVQLQWIPGHCDIYGNERADRLAKDGCLLPQPTYTTSFSSICSRITLATKEAVKETWRADAVGKRWEPIISSSIPNNLPRSIAVATFRMATGHDYLQRHLHRIGIVDSPQCPLCNEGEGTAEHLRHCSALEAHNVPDSFEGQARLYWAARRLMVSQPRTGVG